MYEKAMLVYLRAVKSIAKVLGFDVICVAEGNGVGYVSYSNSKSKTIKGIIESIPDSIGQ